MPIPGLKIKSPQNWKKNNNYPSDRLIAERRAKAIKVSRAVNDSFKKRMLPVKYRVSLFKNKFVGWLVKLAVFGAAAVFVIAFAIFYYYSGQVPTREEFMAKAEGSSTVIYDRTGEHLLYNVDAEQKKTWLPIDQLPEYAKWAVIAMEDDQFYSHRGLDFPALIKVFLHEVFGIGPERGGSTLTQQLVKNTFLSPEKTYRRKFKEMVIAYHMEKKFSKDEILELYFNITPYGSTAYGIEAAAEFYFGKKAQDLTIAEGAVLAAMLQATTYYSPYGSHVDELIARQKFVLEKMAELGYISKEELQTAKEQELEFKKLSQSIRAPHFVLYLKELLAEKYGEEMVAKGGLKIISTLDWDKQMAAEEAIANQITINEERYGGHNAALVSIDAKTGEVLAMVGSRDYFNEEYDGAVNVVFRPRQPGSSFKPIVYAASFLKGLSPDTILFDVTTKFKTDQDDYEPHNYNDKENGPVSIRKALAGSLNIPAVKAIYLTGVDNVLNLAKKMGYTTLGDRSRFGLSLVLGGGEVKLIDHVRAFSVFANDGKLLNLQYLLRVEDKSGKILENFQPEDNLGEEVLDPQVARQITDILSDNDARSYIFGTTNNLILSGRPVAAKTGTTNDYRDGWTIGYTPSLVTGVWAGNNDNTAMNGKADGSNIAAPIWKTYMEKALKDQPVENFTKPERVELSSKPMLNGQLAAENPAIIDRASGKLATALTPPAFVEEKVFREIHSILHYVNKDNILGPLPEHPENDPNYAGWEEAVTGWAAKNGYETLENPPVDYDDLHTIDNKPHLEIIRPTNGFQINNPALSVEVRVNTARTINRVEYYLDGQLLSTKTSYPFNLDNASLVGFYNGEQQLKVIAYDDIDNSREQSISLTLNLEKELTQPINWLNPAPNDVIYQENFPYYLRIKINNYLFYNKVDFYLKKENQSSVWLGYYSIDGPTATTLLTEAAAGSYSLYAVLSTPAGRVIQDKGIIITISSD